MDHGAYLPAAWRVDAYLGGGGDDVPLEALAGHRLACRRAGRRDEMERGGGDDGLEVVDPLALGPPPGQKKKREWGGRAGR